MIDNLVIFFQMNLILGGLYGGRVAGKRRLKIIIAFLCLYLVVFITAAWAQAPLTILYTSEHHGTVMPIEQGEYKGLGGVAARATLIEKIRKETKNILLLDSGDIMVGTAHSTFFRGELDILAMNLMQYDAMTAGNHDFDYGLEHLSHLQDLARFPIICSNFRARSGEICVKSVIKDVGGVKVGIIGLQGRKTFPDTFHPNVARELLFDDPIEKAKELVKRLHREVDLLIALTHQDTEEDLEFAKAIPQIGLIIGGHTSGFDGILTTRQTSPVYEIRDPPTIVVKTHRLGSTLGRLDLLIEDGRIRSASAQNIPVTSAIPPHKEVAGLIATYSARLEELTGKVVGKALVDLDGETQQVRTEETNLGNLLADILREFAGTDLTLVNGGMIRSSIPAGEIKLKLVMQVIPFDSTLVTIKLMGSELKEALEHSLSRLPQASGRFLQVSGITFSYNPDALVGSRIRDVRIGNHPLDPERSYSLSSDNFLAGGGDGYAMFLKGRERRDTQIPIRDLFIQAMQRGPLMAKQEGRIIVTTRESTDAKD